MTTDHQRFEFMQKLVTDVRGKNGIVLTDWESQFLSSWLQSSRPALWFTAGRREATDKMWMRYGGELKHPHPMDTVSERPRLADADPGCCQYLVTDESRRQSRCNEPAVLQEPGRMLYCQLHADTVVMDMKRAGKAIRLVAVKAEQQFRHTNVGGVA